MNDEQKLRADIQRAEKAKMVLNSPLVKEYFDKKRKTIMDNIATSAWDNPGEREELCRMLRLLNDFEKEFIKEIRGGEKAKSLLDKLFKGKN